MIAESRRPPQKRKPQNHGTKWGINIGPKGRPLRTVSSHITECQDVAVRSQPILPFEREEPASKNQKQNRVTLPARSGGKLKLSQPAFLTD
jgi:hypothetical protein